MPNDTEAAPRPEAGTAHLPLSGIVVLDLTLARAGPTAVRHLADWGADVIRIEPPPTGGEDIAGNRHGFDFQNLHRNKRAIQLESEGSRRARSLHAAGAHRRRGDREHARPGEAPAEGRL